MSVVYFEHITVEVTDTDNKSKVKHIWCVCGTLKMYEFPSLVVSCKSLAISFFDGLLEFIVLFTKVRNVKIAVT
jgi:hypothetical protein